MINSSGPAGIRIIGIVKWKSGSSELDCQLTTEMISSSGPAGIRIIKYREMELCSWLAAIVS